MTMRQASFNAFSRDIESQLLKYIYLPSKKELLKITVLFSKLQCLKNKILLKIVGINLMKIREALVSVRVSLGTLPSKEKLKNDNESNNNKNITNNSNKKQ